MYGDNVKRCIGLNPLKKPIQSIKLISDSKFKFFNINEQLVKKLEEGEEIIIQGKKINLKKC